MSLLFVNHNMLCKKSKFTVSQAKIKNFNKNPLKHLLFNYKNVIIKVSRYEN